MGPKTTMPKYVTKDSCSSPLLVQAFSEVITFHGRTNDQLSRLESSMQGFLDLSVQTFTGEEELEFDRKIEEN